MSSIQPPDEPAEIVVVGDVPSSPQVLVNNAFVRELTSAEELVDGLEILSENNLQLSANLFNNLTKAASKLEDARTTLKAPFIDYGRKIDAAAAAVAQRIAAVKSALNVKMRDFREKQAAIAREAEQKRQEELRRLEQQRLAEERERQRLADEEAARIRAAQPKIAAVELDLPPDEPTPVEQKIAEVQAAPAIVAPKPQGVRYDITLKFEVEDVSKLPDAYVTKSANLSKIRGLTAGYREGQPLPVVPGVRFFEDRQFRGTGR
jgi:hypothetical protein